MIIPFLFAMDFLNFTYATNPCPKDVPVPVAMDHGYFSYENKDMGAGFDLEVVSVHEGSLQSGTRQAVVVVECEFPMGGTAAAYVFDERNGKAVQVAHVADANWGGDWGNPPSSIHVRFANRFLYVDACQDDNCKQYVVTTYALRGGKLTKVYVETHKPPT